MKRLSLVLVACGACVPLGTQSTTPSSSTAPSPPVQAPLDPESAAWAEKQAAFDAKFAAELAEFRELQPRLAGGGAADAKLVADADKLRARFVKRCVEESGFSTVACWNGTFARDITEALSKQRLQIGDKVGAYVEAYSLFFYPDLRSEQAKREAARQGVDEGPANVRSPEDMRELEDQIEFVAEEVRAVVRTKTTATIRFAVRESSSTGYECGDRYVVVAADPTTASGNKLAVKQKCKVSRHDVQRESFPSVTVPVEEVEGLKAGQRAFVVFPKKTKRGHLIDVWPDAYTKEYIRFRTTRQKKAEPGYP
ncbi:MAG TPA: hypothetical protein VIV11_28735 [Kofleriaceae bacterium]